MVLADGSLWVADVAGDTVSRVDLVRRRTVATVTVGAGPIAVAAVGRWVWVADYQEATVARIDSSNDRVTAKVATGPSPVSVVLAGARLWVFNQGNATATIIDPSTTKVIATVPTGARAGFATLALNRLWVPDFQGDHRVVELDPATGRVVRRVTVGGSPISVSFASGSGWVSNTADGTVTRFDPADGRTLATIGVPGGSLGPLLATPRGVWVSVYGGDRLAEIDSATNTVVGTIATGHQPQNMVLDGAALWLDESGPGDVRQVTQTPAP